MAKHFPVFKGKTSKTKQTSKQIIYKGEITSTNHENLQWGAPPLTEEIHLFLCQASEDLERMTPVWVSKGQANYFTDRKLVNITVSGPGGKHPKWSGVNPGCNQ